MVIADDVQKTSLKLSAENLQPQLQFMLNDAKINSFTPVFSANKQFITLLVVKKEGTSALGFETVKAKIFNDIMMNREKKYLKDYFEKQKLTADIKIVR